MIIKLIYGNRLPIPVELHSNLASRQPLIAGQELEMTFELHENEDGVAEIILNCMQVP
jgi:hypothetical protein